MCLGAKFAIDWFKVAPNAPFAGGWAAGTDVAGFGLGRAVTCIAVSPGIDCTRLTNVFSVGVTRRGMQHQRVTRG